MSIDINPAEIHAMEDVGPAANSTGQVL